MLFNNDGVFMELNDGTYMEAVPLPYYLWFGRVRCGECRQKFGSEEQYGIHYAAEHTDGKRYRRDPLGLHEIKEEGGTNG